MSNNEQPFVPYGPPLLGEDESKEVLDTLKTTWITTGPKTKKFENEFSYFLGASSALALNSCTAGLFLALKVHGVGPGDEIITTPMTFCASVNVIEHLGATPVLVDIHDSNFLINENLIEAAITEKTKGIVPVHYAGESCNMDSINRIAEKHSLFVLEDAAHAFFTKYNNSWVGSGKNLTAFSFYANKNLTTGEGGMLTGPSNLVDKARVLSLHGMSKNAWKRFDKSGSWRYDVVGPGYKYNMTDLAAALGLAQLRKIEAMQSRRAEIVTHYKNTIDNIDGLSYLDSVVGSEGANHLFVVKVGPKFPIGRDQLIEELKKRNIGTSVHYIPIHFHSYYKDKYGWENDSLPVCSAMADVNISLPMSPALSDFEIGRVTAELIDIATNNG